MASSPEDLATAYVRSALQHSRTGSLVDAAADLHRALSIEECPDRARVLVEASQTHMQMGELAEATALAEEAAELATTAGDEQVAMLALGTLGQLHKRRGNYRAALQIARDGAERAQRLGDRAEWMTFTQDESFALDALGDPDGAITAAVEAREIARGGLGPREQLRASGSLGSLFRRAGRLDEAEQAATAGVELARRLGDRDEEASYLVDIGLLLLLRQRPDEAAAAFGEAFVVVIGAGRWEFASRLVTTILNDCTGPGEVEILWLAARAGVLVALRCGDALRPTMERLIMEVLFNALRLGPRTSSEAGLVRVWEQLRTAGPDPARPSPVPLLGAAFELVVLWFDGRSVADHADTIRQLDRALGIEPQLRQLLAGTP